MLLALLGVLIVAGGAPASAATVTVLQSALTPPVLSGPISETFDSGGDLFIANAAANAVTVMPSASASLFGQLVDADASATLVAASGLDDPVGIAFDSAGNLYVANDGNNTVTVVPKTSGTLFGQSVTADIPVTLTAASGLHSPYAIAFDSAGDLYIADEGTNAVTVVSKTTTTLFGQSVTANTAATLTAAASGLDEPVGLAFDSNGDLFVADYVDNEVTVVPKTTGTLFGQSVTANTAATLAAASSLNEPYGIAFDSAGDLYVTNYGNNIVRVVPKTTATLFGQSVTANTPVTLTAPSGLTGPTAIGFDTSGDLWIANYTSNTETLVPKASGTVFAQSVSANTSTTLKSVSLLVSPEFEAFDGAGDLFITSTDNDTVTVIPKATGTLFGQSVTANTAVPLTAASGLDNPQGIAIDSAGDLFIANDNNTVTVVPKTTGTLFGQSVTANTAVTLNAATGLSDPAGIKFDSAGDLYIANQGNNTVTVIPAATGTLFGQSVTAHTALAIMNAATGISVPYALGFDGAGNLYVVNNGVNTVTVLPDATGTLFGQSVTVNTAATLSHATGLSEASGVAFDAAGDMFVANYNDNVITVLPAATGLVFGQPVTADTATSLAGATLAAGVSLPNDVAFDSAGGLLVVDAGNDQISEVQATPAAPAAPSATATGVSGQVSLSWTAPVNGDATITGYTVTPSPACAGCTGLTVSGSPPATSTTIGGLTGGTAYTFTVTATNSVGLGNASAASAAVTPAATAPGAPTGVSAVAGNASATVTFTAPASDGATITSYTVTASPGGAQATGSGSPIVVGNLANGTSYTFTVTATNSAGTGPASATSSAVTPSSPVNVSSGGSGSSSSGGSSSSSSSGSSSTKVPSLTLVGTKLTITAHTKTKVTLSCAVATCKGTASLTTKIVTIRHKGKNVIRTTKTRVFGTVSFTISAGKHATETIHLNKAGKAAFGHATKTKPLHCMLTTTVKGGKTRLTRVTLV